MSRVLNFIGHELTRRGPLSPALIQHEEQRATSLQSRAADVITGFAGSMSFVYVHIAWFAFWIALPVEKYPFGLLTMIVSLEAIFLSTFVMISQNRADARRQVFADNQYEMIQAEQKQKRGADRPGQAYRGAHRVSAGADAGSARHPQSLGLSSCGPGPRPHRPGRQGSPGPTERRSGRCRRVRCRRRRR